MYSMLESYIKNLSKDNVNSFALKNNISLNPQELDFTYNFIKNNYKDVLSNPNSFNFNSYRNNFSEDSFNKIDSLIKKYSAFL